jgi:hypothetical protein
MFVILMASTIDKQINRPAHLYCCTWIFFGEPSARFFLLHLMPYHVNHTKAATKTSCNYKQITNKSPTNHLLIMVCHMALTDALSQPSSLDLAQNNYNKKCFREQSLHEKNTDGASNKNGIIGGNSFLVRNSFCC